MKNPIVSWDLLLGLSQSPGTRREPRYVASDPEAIVLQPGLGDVSATVRGEFMDRSDGGCRIQHRFGALRISEVMSIVWREQTRNARVVWNRIADDVAETGFSFVD